MSSAKRDKQIFNLAESFLNGLTTKDGLPVTQEMLSKYFRIVKPKTLSDIYIQLLKSAQNASMKAGVIGGAIGGIERLRDALCDFEPKVIIQKYGNDSQIVLVAIKKQVKPRGKVNPNGLWSKYCATIVSGAKFLG